MGDYNLSRGAGTIDTINSSIQNTFGYKGGGRATRRIHPRVFDSGSNWDTNEEVTTLNLRN